MRNTRRCIVKCETCGWTNQVDKYMDLMYFANSNMKGFECEHCHTFQLVSARKIKVAETPER